MEYFLMELSFDFIFFRSLSRESSLFYILSFLVFLDIEDIFKMEVFFKIDFLSKVEFFMILVGLNMLNVFGSYWEMRCVVLEQINCM